MQEKQTPVSLQNEAAAPSQAPNQHEENAVVSQADHRVNLRRGEISVGAGYSYFSGPAFLSLYYPYRWGFGYAGFWGAYSPSWWDPWWHPYGAYRGYGPADDRGEIRLQVEPNTADVLIDGAYAGTVASLKSTVWLDPGAYNLCVKAAGHSDYCRRIYVLSGKRLQVLARLVPITGEVKP